MRDFNTQRGPRRHYILWWAIGLHLSWGVALNLDPDVAPIAVLVGLHWLLDLGMAPHVLGLVLIITALAASVSLTFGHSLRGNVALALLLPQYGLLLGSLVADSTSVITGRVDTRDVDRVVLFTALCPLMIAALLHSAAIVERHVLWTKR